MINRVVSIIASVAIHAAVLWLYKPKNSDIPLAAGDPAGESVDVDLVEPGAAPEPLPAVEEMPPEPVPPEPVPPQPEPEEVTPPEPTPPPEPMPEPKPELPPPPPDAIPEPTPKPVEQPKPKPKPVAKPAPRPAVQPARAAPTPGGTTAAGAIPGSNAGSADGSRARYKNKVKPTYPPSLKKSGSQGRVQVVVVVSASGKPISARISRSSGNPLFDQAALAAARASDFYPKKNLGVAVEDTVLIPYNFAVTD